jgi:hypothetical protein
MEQQKRSLESRLQDHPLLRERVEAILDIAEGKSNGPDTANEVEERTIIEVRKLGNEVIADWAKDKASREHTSYRSSHPKAVAHKKKESTGTPHLDESR